MTQTLPQVTHEHHERILHAVDRMPEIADRLLTAKADDVRPELAELQQFFTGSLLPHIDASEQTMYPELERMFQNRHSMAPMRREHEEVRRLIGTYTKLAAELQVKPMTLGKALAVRRVMYQLYSVIKIHVAEEEAYLRIVDRGVTGDVADMLAAAMEHPLATKA
jgi:iron-sulfur cluster repair protein YtfE (RIC family)